VIAKIVGDCIGGGLEIAASCDLRYAADSARFGAPIGRLGFSMAPEELTALLRVAAPSVCAELLFEGRLFDASEALARGLVTRLVKPELLDGAVDQAIARIMAQAPRAQRINKVLLRTLSDAALNEAQRLFAFSYAETRDHQEGVAAFLERREPHFTNN
jgi:enoyl-CoA hydratase/carnithine racemase